MGRLREGKNSRVIPRDNETVIEMIRAGYSYRDTARLTRRTYGSVVTVMRVWKEKQRAQKR